LEKSTFRLSPASTSIIAISVFWYPLEVVMLNLSGRSYVHYYMAICAICTVLFAFLADRIEKVLVIYRIPAVNILVTLGWSIGIILTLIYNPINTMRVIYTPESNQNNQISETVQYLVANTQPDDKVLIWGAEPVINFLSNRSSATRFTYVNTFYTKGYGGKAVSAEVLADIQANKPLIIIYTGDTPFVNITPEHNCTLPSQALPDGMDSVMKAICANYHYFGNIGPAGWKIYRINQ
jgi:hypothetical protein